MEVSGGPMSAYADAGGLQSRTIPADVSPLTNEQLWMTPGGPYEPDSGNPASFNYIMINQNGWYRADFYVYWSTDFTGGTFPIIRPGCVIDGSPDFLSVAFDDPAFWPGYDNTQSWIGGEQFGISNTLDTTFVGSKNIGGYFTVVRLGDYMEAVT
jgi:hypothetical protein